jgi:hypothetical protein
MTGVISQEDESILPYKNFWPPNAACFKEFVPGS